MTGLHYKGWTARAIEERDIATPSPVNRLLATLDDPCRLSHGDPLPPLAHWLYFLDDTPEADLAQDGHAPRGDFLPPVDLSHRMFGGSDVAFLAPLHLGPAMHRRREVIGIEEKSGRRGAIVLVRIKYDVFQEDRHCLSEIRTILYRDGGAAFPLPDPGSGFSEAEPGEVTRDVWPDPVLLFRYSALTFNAHRIHYDTPYATGTESYPGLVVHGPLLATLLAHDAWRGNSAAGGDPPVAGVAFAHFSFRATAPAFANQPVRLFRSRLASETRLRAERPDGLTAIRATMTAR